MRTATPIASPKKRAESGFPQNIRKVQSAFKKYVGRLNFAVVFFQRDQRMAF